MKIIIKESQIRLLSEDLETGDVSHVMRESIAVWCLTNEFRFYGPNGLGVANDDKTQRQIAYMIMKAYSIDEANNDKELFGYNDYDDSQEGDDERDEYMNYKKIYKVTTEDGDLLIEVADNIYESDGDITLQSFADGELDEYDEQDINRIKWFYNIFR